MVPFYINAFLILFIDLIINVTFSDEQKKRKYICIINTIQIILFISLRDVSVGNDTQNYVNFFEGAVRNPKFALNYEHFEIGFKYYVYAIARLTSNPRIFLAIGAVLSVLPIGYIIYKYSKDCTISFYAFCTMEFIMFSMTGMRQNVAYFFVYTSFILFNSEKKQQNIIALVLIAFAGFFHKSAWAFVILYGMTLIKNTSWKKLIYVGGVVGSFIFRNQIGHLLVYRFYNNYEVNATGAYSRVFIVLIVLMLVCMYYDMIAIKSERDVVVANGKSLFPVFADSIFLTTFFFIIALVVSAAARQGRYYFIFFTLLLPEFQYIIRKDQRFVFKVLCYILLTLLMFCLFPHNGLCTYGYYFWRN